MPARRTTLAGLGAGLLLTAAAGPAAAAGRPGSLPGAAGPAASAGSAASTAAVTSAAGALRATGGTGPLDGLSTTDVLFLNALQTTAGTLGQVTVGQSAAAASTTGLGVHNALGERILDAPAGLHNADGHGAGVSLNLGSAPGSVPQARLTLAEALAPPPATTSTALVRVPAAPVATATALPSTAEAHTTTATGSAGDFCPTVGGPIAAGTAAIAAAALAPTATGGAVATLDSAARVRSEQRLLGNGTPGRFGLSSLSTLSTAGLTLFPGTPGAQITIRVVAPVALQAYASGIAGHSGVSFGDHGAVPAVTVSTGSGTVALTLTQLLGGGATISVGGLLTVHIGLTPTASISPDGTSVTAAADLVRIGVVSAPAASTGSVGGPLGPTLSPILGTVLRTLDSTSVVRALDSALRAAGITSAADIRLGHFESRALVPAGGVACSLPVTKTASPDPVTAGHAFTYTITITNPFSCVLDPVRVVDHLLATPGVVWTVTGGTPTPTTVGHDTVTWDNVGPIAAHSSRVLTIAVLVGPTSAAGRFTDAVAVSALCAGAGGTGNAAVNNGAGGGASVTGGTTVTVPGVLAAALAAAPPRALAYTGLGTLLPGVGAVLLLAGLGVAWSRRRPAAG